MNEKADIALIDASLISMPTEIFRPGGIESILAQIAERARSEIPDASTHKGRAAIASLAHRVARSKTALDDAGKSLVAGWKQQAALVDAERKRARDFLDALKEEIRRPLTDWEQEQERIEREEAEAKARAEQEAQREREAAERAEREETQRKLREAEQALAAEREAREKAERERQMALDALHREEQQKIEDANRIERDRLKLERDRLELERQQQEADAAAARQRLAEQQRIAQEAQKRVNDAAHRAQLRYDIISDLSIVVGLSDRDAGDVADALLAESIRHISINY